MEKATLKATPRSTFIQPSVSHLKLVGLTENKKRQNHVLTSFKSLLNSLERSPDISLIEDVAEFSNDSPIKFKLIDVITVYRNLLEAMGTLSFEKKKTCDMAISEIEKNLYAFLDNGIFPETTFRIKDIFVEELVDVTII